MRSIYNFTTKLHDKKNNQTTLSEIVLSSSSSHSQHTHTHTLTTQQLSFLSLPLTIPLSSLFLSHSHTTHTTQYICHTITIEATVDADRVRIMADIETSIGIGMMNQHIKSTLFQWLGNTAYAAAMARVALWKSGTLFL